MNCWHANSFSSINACTHQCQVDWKWRACRSGHGPYTQHNTQSYVESLHYTKMVCWCALVLLPRLPCAVDWAYCLFALKAMRFCAIYCLILLVWLECLANGKRFSTYSNGVRWKGEKGWSRKTMVAGIIKWNSVHRFVVHRHSHK